MLVIISSASATIRTSVPSPCDLSTVNPGQDRECGAAIKHLDNGGGAEAIEWVVQFQLSNGECWQPRLSFKYIENDFEGTTEWIKLYQGSNATLIETCGVEGLNQNCDWQTCLDAKVLSGEIGAAGEVDILVSVSESVGGVLGNGEEICPGGASIEAELTLTCKTPSEAPTPSPTREPTTSNPTLHPTANPTPGPTVDGCEFDPDAYVKQCFGGVSPWTPAPTPSGCLGTGQMCLSNQGC